MEFDPNRLPEINNWLRTQSSMERMQWADRTFKSDLAMLASMQKTACVLMHHVYRAQMQAEVLFVDTGFHFHETLKMRDDYMLKYRLNLVTLYPVSTPEQQEQIFGSKLHLSVDGQPECCRMRKEEPFLNHMRSTGKRAILSGLRAGEGGKRKQLEPIMPDPRFGGYVIHPIIDWQAEDIDKYLAEHQVPIHPLYAKDYLSIGCACCTTPVMPGEDERAGRWRHLRTGENTQPVYCGINFSDGSGI